MALQGEKRPSLKVAILDGCQDVFASKTCLTVIGFALKVALVCTLLQTAPIAETGSVEGFPKEGKALAGFVVAYLLLVTMIVAMKWFMTRHLVALKGQTEARAGTLKLYMSGLDVIPAWAFKDCVAGCLSASGRHGILAAVLVLLVATVLTVLADPGEPPADEQPDVIYSLRKTVAGSMGLGVGFAFNGAAQIWWASNGWEWWRLSLQLVWAPVVTALVLLVQFSIGGLGSDRGRFQMAFLNFVKVAGNFVAAWAWDGVLDTARITVLAHHDLDEPDACFSAAGVTFLWAILVLVLGATVVVAHAVHLSSIPGERSQREKDCKAFVAIICGVNAAWATLDFAIGFNRCLSFGGYVVLGAWIFAIAVVIVISAVLVVFTRVVETLKGIETEPSWPRST